MRVMRKKPAKNNSEIICPQFHSEINRFNTYNTNLIVKFFGLTLVGHRRLLPSRNNSKLMNIIKITGLLFYFK